MEHSDVVEELISKRSHLLESLEKISFKFFRIKEIKYLDTQKDECSVKIEFLEDEMEDFLRIISRLNFIINEWMQDIEILEEIIDKGKKATQGLTPIHRGACQNFCVSEVTVKFYSFL